MEETLGSFHLIWRVSGISDHQSQYCLLLKGHDWYTFQARGLAFLFEPYGSLHSSRNT